MEGWNGRQRPKRIVSRKEKTDNSIGQMGVIICAPSLGLSLAPSSPDCARHSGRTPGAEGAAHPVVRSAAPILKSSSLLVSSGPLPETGHLQTRSKEELVSYMHMH